MSEHKRQKPCNCKASEDIKKTRDYLKYYGGVESDLKTEPKWKAYPRYFAVLLVVAVLTPFLFIYVLVNLTWNIIRGNGNTVSLGYLQKYFK